MSKRFNISFEELEEVIQTPEELELDHQRLALELDEDSREIDYQSDLVTGLEDLQFIASKLDNPTPVQVALFRVAANMAVAGKDKDAKNFLPAMESNKPISLEGFGEKIKETIKVIIAKIQKWFKNFKIFINNIFTSNKKKKEELNKNIEELKTSAKEEDSNIKKDVPIGVGLLTLAHSKKDYIKTDEIENNIKDYKELGLSIDKVIEKHDVLFNNFISNIKRHKNDCLLEKKEYYNQSSIIFKNFEKEIGSNKEFLDGISFSFETLINKNDGTELPSCYQNHKYNKDSETKLNISKNDLIIFLNKLKSYTDDIPENKYEEIEALDKNIFLGDEETNTLRSKNIISIVNNQTFILMLKSGYNSRIKRIYTDLNFIIKHFKTI